MRGNVSPLVEEMLMEIIDTVVPPTFYYWCRRYKHAPSIPHIIVTCVYVIIVGLTEISSNCAHVETLN